VRDGLDQPFVAQRFDCAADGVARHCELVHEVLLRGQRILAGPELADLYQRT
jgi:hypothetical protein